jgi:hypothetical protein
MYRITKTVKFDRCAGRRELDRAYDYRWTNIASVKLYIENAEKGHYFRAILSDGTNRDYIDYVDMFYVSNLFVRSNGRVIIIDGDRIVVEYYYDREGRWILEIAPQTTF